MLIGFLMIYQDRSWGLREICQM